MLGSIGSIGSIGRPTTEIPGSFASYGSDSRLRHSGGQRVAFGGPCAGLIPAAAELNPAKILQLRNPRVWKYCPYHSIVYRQRWQHDKIVRPTHGVNCTGS